MKRCRYSAEIPNELPVKISEAQEAMYVLTRSEYWQVNYSLDLILIHFYLAFRNDITQK